MECPPLARSRAVGSMISRRDAALAWSSISDLDGTPLGAKSTVIG
jgi:hypothetical protein